MRQPIGHRNGIDDHESVPQRLGFAEHAHRFGVAQMRMHIHEPDFAAEERSQLRPPEDLFRPPVIGDRPVHQARAVGKQQALADDAKMAPRLFLGEDPADDPLCHGQQREREARQPVAWMKQ